MVILWSSHVRWLIGWIGLLIGVGRVVESFVGSVDMGGCCNGIVEACEVVLRFSPKGGLHFLGMADLLQGVYLSYWEFVPN